PCTMAPAIMLLISEVMFELRPLQLPYRPSICGPSRERASARSGVMTSRGSSDLRAYKLTAGVLSFLLVASAASPAFADHLKVAADAPLWVRLGAGAILYTHIGGGTVGLLSGTVALLARKGGKLHRRSGNIFLAAMLVMAGIGAVVAPFLPDRVSAMA